MHTEAGSKRDGGAEPEDGEEEVEDEWQHAVDCESLVEGRRYQEEQAEHCKRGAKHGVAGPRLVDVSDGAVFVEVLRVLVDGRVGAHCDRVTDDGHDEQAHEELEATKAEAEKLCHAHVDGVVDGVA